MIGGTSRSDRRRLRRLRRICPFRLRVHAGLAGLRAGAARIRTGFPPVQPIGELAAGIVAAWRVTDPVGRLIRPRWLVPAIPLDGVAVILRLVRLVRRAGEIASRIRHEAAP